MTKWLSWIFVFKPDKEQTEYKNKKKQSRDSKRWQTQKDSTVTITQLTNSTVKTCNQDSRCLNHTLIFLCFYPSFFSSSLSSLLAFFHFSPFSFVFLSLSLFVVLHTIIHTCNKQKTDKKKINSLLFDTLLHVGLVGLVETSSIPTKKNNSKKQNMSFFMYCFCRCSVLVRFKDDKTTYIWNTVFTNAYQGWPQRHDGRGRFPTPSAGRPVEWAGVCRVAPTARPRWLKMLLCLLEVFAVL